METPGRSKTLNIPPSPMMQTLGYGTGITVYKMNRSSIQDTTKSPWALKKLSYTAKKHYEISSRLKDEATILRRLNHPNIIGFRGFEDDNVRGLCLAMETCSKSLGELIEDRRENDLAPYESRAVLKVAQDMFNALTYLHGLACILHGDIKSYNVLVNGDFDICKLCDFGVSVPLDNDGNVVKDNAKEEDYVGTLAWCAPEVLCFNQIVTSKVDIYAAGLVLWEMLALSVPPLPENNDGDETIDEENEEKRIRPDLPDHPFSKDYNVVFEIYFCCTEQDYKKRPAALDIMNTFF